MTNNKSTSKIPSVAQVKPGSWLGKLPDDGEAWLSYGYRFTSNCNGAFNTTYSVSSVYVYAVVEVWRRGEAKSTRYEIVPEQAVGKARLVREADKIGRAKVSEIVRPALQAYFEQPAPPHTRHPKVDGLSLSLNR